MNGVLARTLEVVELLLVCFSHIIDDTWQVQLNIVITKMPYLIFVISIYSLHIDICKKDSKLT